LGDWLLQSTQKYVCSKLDLNPRKREH